MSDEEMEDFEIKDDDLMHAFNPGYRKSKMSKEQAMLGIWASSDEDEDNDDQFSYKKQKSKNLLSSGISFVSSAKKHPKKDEDDDEGQDDNESEEDSRSSMKRMKQSEILHVESSESESETASNKQRYGKFSKDYKKRPFASGNSVKEEKTTTRSFKSHQPNKSEYKDIGNWEKHTKGIGMKLLEKMGWQKGLGIGKELQGRVVPVEAVVRKGKGSVGMYGRESKDIKAEAEITEQKEVQVSRWKKNKKNEKYKHRTIEELLELAEKNPKEFIKTESQMSGQQMEDDYELSLKTKNKIKIIDMTGKEQRVMHGYESIGQMAQESRLRLKEEGKEAKLFDLPELTNNLDLIVMMTEDKIILNDKKCKHFGDMVVSLSYEEKKIKKMFDEESEQIYKIENLLEAIEKCEKAVQEEECSIEQLLKLFTIIKSKYPDEFLIFNLSQLAIPLITPILKAKMIRWDPFGSSIEDEQDEEINDLDYCKDVYAEVKSMLQDTISTTRTKRTNLNMFDRIVWETWMPSFRRIVAKEEMKNISVRCVSLLKNWQPILPSWILENILESIIMPKLIDEVDEWDPTVDRIPIHIWIHPWLNLIQNRLETTVFAQIRFKLSNALTNWHPSDASAKAILSPWQPPVFNKNSWDSFICKNIIPKLETVINNEMIINPGEQNLEEWQWISSWQDIIPMASFVDLVEKNFFPKWLKVLCAWLNSSPNYEEVSKWYMGWKSIMGEKLTEHPNIKMKLSQALMMMNRSVSGVKVNYQMFETIEPKKTEAELTEEREEPSESFKAKGIQTSSSVTISSFKDIIEKKAAEHNLMFMPVLNRFKEGKQIYRLGNLNMYIDRNVIFMQQNGVWIPASISDLIQKAL